MEHAPAFCLLPFLRSPRWHRNLKTKTQTQRTRDLTYTCRGQSLAEDPDPVGQRRRRAAVRWEDGDLPRRGGAGRGPRGHVGRVPIPSPFLDRRNRDLSALGIRPPRRYGRLGRVQELLGAGPAAAPSGHRHRRGHGYRKGHRHGASAPGYASGPPGSSYLRSRGRQRHTLASGGFGSQEVGGRAGGHGLAKPRGCTCRRR